MLCPPSLPRHPSGESIVPVSGAFGGTEVCSLTDGASTYSMRMCQAV